MDTKVPTLNDPHSRAASEVFRLRKTEKRMTFPTLAAKTGIKVQTLKRLINGHTSIHMDNFYALCDALEIDPGEAATQVRARMAKVAA